MDENLAERPGGHTRLLRVMQYLGLADDVGGARGPGLSRYWTGRGVSRRLDEDLDDLRRRVAELEARRD
ncbi:hypothetical protein [Kineococcus sp. NPDC059986]|uniref:hypothetical protein n=1 Tax=Kineococcus sp. NPDC059986 TaxID=3155538 RepID=UPI00344FB7ED